MAPRPHTTSSGSAKKPFPIRRNSAKKDRLSPHVRLLLEETYRNIARLERWGLTPTSDEKTDAVKVVAGPKHHVRFYGASGIRRDVASDAPAVKEPVSEIDSLRAENERLKRELDAANHRIGLMNGASKLVLENSRLKDELIAELREKIKAKDEKLADRDRRLRKVKEIASFD